MTKNLSYFMREQKEEIVNAPAPESFVDENGNRLELEIKTISNDKIRKIQDNYRKRSIALDNSGNPYLSTGEVVFQTENDINRAMRHIVAEALVYPDLKSKELMDFYHCYDISEMPLKVFHRPGEYSQVFNSVMSVLGLIKKDEDSDEVKEAKN